MSYGNTAINMTITPDLQTREAVMLAAGRAQFSVTYPSEQGGGTRYVKLECKRKNPEGSEKRYSPSPLEGATHVFISEKGYGTERIGTYYPPKPGSKYKSGRLFLADGVHEDDGHVEALQILVEYVNGNHVALLDGFGIEVESRCGLCGRKLEDPISVKRGIGPECAGKPTGTKILHASAFGQDELTPENQAKVTEAQEAADAKIAEIQADAEAEIAAVKQGLYDYIEDLRAQTVEPTAQQKSLC